MTSVDSLSSQNQVELFRYLRTLVDTSESSRVNHPKFALVEAYWHIGRIVVEIEQSGQARADYGIHLIESLSLQLTNTFGKGYSLPNMWRFKQFYLAFPILSTSRREFPNLRKHIRQELKWSHYRFLMQIKNLQERAFYIQQAADELWSVRELQRLVNNRYYYRVALGETELLGKPASSPPLPLAVGSTRSRLALVKKTLLERYVSYAYVTQRQYTSVNGQDQWIDLVFFHIMLQRYILIFLIEHNPTSVADVQQILDHYVSKQPPGSFASPIGLLVNTKGQVKHLTVSVEIELSIDVTSALPIQFY